MPVKSFNYQETTGRRQPTDNLLWATPPSPSPPVSTERFARSIAGARTSSARSRAARSRTCRSTPSSRWARLQSKVPTEVLVTDRREYELAEQGFIALTMRKGSDNAAFFSANSVQKPKNFGNTAEGKQAELNYKLGTQLPT